MTLEELEEVLLSIALKDDNPNDADTSFLKLYRHYSVPLQSIIKVVLKKMGVYNVELMDTALNNTFVKIFENPPLDFKIKEDNTLDNCFIAYLVTITKNEILNLLKPKDYNKMTVLESDVPDVAFEEFEIDDSFVGINAKTLNDALNTLKQEHKEIILALYNYHEEGKKTPTEVLDILCKTYGTTRDSIRQIKKRGVDKIIEYFSKNSNLIPLKNVK